MNSETGSALQSSSTQSDGPRTLIIGISGPSGSGKTTLTRRVLERVDQQHILHLQHDDYYRSVDQFPDDLRDPLNFDHPHALETELLVEHLHLLRQGRGINQPRYDFTTHSRLPRWQKVDFRPVILVEGILVLENLPLRQQMDIKIFVDTPVDLCFLRRLRRDISERGRDLENVIRQYLTTVRPMYEKYVEQSRQHADLIVLGEGENSAVVDLLVTKIDQHLGMRSHSTST